MVRGRREMTLLLHALLFTSTHARTHTEHSAKRRHRYSHSVNTACSTSLSAAVRQQILVAASHVAKPAAAAASSQRPSAPFLPFHHTSCTSSSCLFGPCFPRPTSACSGTVARLARCLSMPHHTSSFYMLAACPCRTIHDPSTTSGPGRCVS